MGRSRAVCDLMRHKALGKRCLGPKTTTIFLLIFFTFFNCVPFVPQATAQEKSPIPHTPKPLTLSIPEEFGTIEESHQGSNHKTVIYIQDAHDSLEAQEKVEEVAKKTYKVLNMFGFSRSEFILVKDEPYFLEMNTVPGLTEESILPQQAKAAGISLKELFDNAIVSSLNS